VKKEYPSPLLQTPELCENDDLKCRNDLQLDADLDAIWKVAIGLDLENRSVLEAEVLMWRICSAKSMPNSTIRRALYEEWGSDT
jgi:hypothetical protein